VKKLYPSPTAKRGNILANGDVYYCEQCGMGCRKSKVQVARLYQRTGDTIEITTDGSQPTNIEVLRGCPFCGSMRSKIR